MLEKEYKCLINEETYKKTKKAYAWDSVYVQTNHYYAAHGNYLSENRITVRIREKNGIYKIQVKRHKNKENALHISEETEFEADSAPDRISAERAIKIIGADVGELRKIGTLTTLRHSCMWDDDTEICLDKSTFFDRTDYEIEVEYGKEAPEELMNELKLLGADFSKPVIGKYSRFVRHLGEIINGG